MAIDWSQPLYSRDGQRGVLRDPCPSHSRRRVFFEAQKPGNVPGTVYLYGEDGRTRGDGSDSPMDLSNEPATRALAA